MFGTEIKIITIIFLIVEILMVSSLIISWASRPSDKSMSRFLFLILIFIYYNLSSGFLPDENITLLPLIIQNVLAYSSGIAVAIYFFYYLTVEMDITVGKFNPKSFGVILVTSFLLSYVLTYIVTEDKDIARIIFIGFPITLALSFSWTTIKILLKKYKEVNPNTPFKSMFYASYFGILCMCLFPICVAFGDYQNIEGTIVNSSLFFVFFAYVKRHIYQSKIESQDLTDKLPSNNEERKYDINRLKSILTPREMEVVFMLFNESYTYSDIANEMFINSKTVSKHASNIFKKTNTKTRKDFLETLELKSQQIENQTLNSTT
mgnify:CR=1 FL=1